jgi:hypothetical protein
VFALSEFRAGAAIGDIEDVVVTTNPRSPPWKRWALIIGRTPEGEHLFWDEIAEGSEAYWSNFLDHSSNPNVRFVIDTARGCARLEATKDVEPGDELFLNYRDYHADNWAPD